MIILWQLFLCLVGACLFIVPHALWYTQFVESFIVSDAIWIFWTLLWLNLATTAFLLPTLNSIQEKVWDNKEWLAIVDNIKKETKQNIYFMIISFCLFLWINAFIEIGEWNISNLSQGLLYLNCFIFSLGIFAVYDTTATIFTLSK